MAWPVRRDIKITRGATYSHVLRFFDDEAQTDPSNMTGHTITAQARVDYDDDTAVAFAVDASGAATGVFVLSLTPTQTASMLSPDDQGVWDVDDTHGGTVTTPFGGAVRMHAQVTR